jgi:hypothetical protein
MTIDGPNVPTGPARVHPEGTKILVMGALGMAIIPPLAPIAWRRAGRVLAEIDASGVRTINRPYVVGGRVCGAIGTVVWGLIAIILAVLVVVGVIGALFD